MPCRATVKVGNAEDDVVCKEGKEGKVPSPCDAEVDGYGDSNDQGAKRRQRLSRRTDGESWRLNLPNDCSLANQLNDIAHATRGFPAPDAQFRSEERPENDICRSKNESYRGQRQR